MIKKVSVSIENLSSCTVYPHAKMDESYRIDVSSTGVSINSPEIWGTIRAFETLSQSIFWNDETNCLIFEQTIQDEPEFSHRGFMIDTARHFLTWDVMEQFLDGMAYLAVGECMHSQIWNNSGSDGSINVVFCEWIEQILNNCFMKFYQICV